MRARSYIGIMLLCVSASCYAGKTANDSFIGAGVENFQWTETAPDGTQYLEESGKRYFVTLTSLSDRTANLDYDFHADIYFGGVDYDGQTQGGIPVFTTTNYSGVRTEILFNRYFATSQVQSLGILGGVGLDFWKRELTDAFDIQGHLVYGYTETYFMGYLKLGAVWQLHSPWQQKLSAGIKYPIFIDEYISSPSITLRPNPTTTTFVSWQHLIPFSSRSGAALEFFVERTHFDISDPVIVGPYVVVQPESNIRTAGLKISSSY